MHVKNAIVLNDYDYVQGGASLVAIECANILYNAGLNVYFFCSVSDKEKSILDKNIPVISCNEYDSINNKSKIKGLKQGLNNKVVAKKMKELLLTLDCNNTVVFIHGWTKALSASFIQVCHKFNFKTILTGHDYFSICQNGGLFNYKKNVICNKVGKISCRFCNCDSRNYFYKIYRNLRIFYQNKIFKFRNRINYLITISDTSESLLKPFFKKSQIIRIYNPVSIQEKKNRIEVKENKYYIYVGRVDKEKGINKICDSVIKANKKLVIVGNGNVYSELVEKYASNNIVFTGWINHDEVLNYMNKAKALIFPSLLYEGAPLTIFEAQSYGLPCFVSNRSAGKDFITKNTGWVYDPYSEELTSLLNNISDVELEQKSINSYNMFWENPYSKEKYKLSLLKLLEKI